MRILIVAVLLATACRPAIQPDNSAEAYGNLAATPLTHGAQPVRIGETGANFAACVIRGVVTAQAALPVRTAPFAEAAAAGEATPGQHVYVCTRSIDQRWLGVVVPPAPAADAPLANEVAPIAECGLDARVESPRPYSGPCLSGWVASAMIRLTAR